MVKNGRPRKPTALKLLDGTFRKDRETPIENQPTPSPVGKVQPPSVLGKVGLKFWHDHFELLKGLGLLTDPDVYLFGQLCLAVESLASIDEDIKKHGLTYINKDGEIKRNPITIQRRDIAAEVHKLTARFGMTPADRSGMQVDKPKRESKVKFKPLGT